MLASRNLAVGGFAITLGCIYCLIGTPVVFADIPVPVFAPDPGDPPPYTPQIHPAFLVAAMLFSTAAVLFGLSAHVRGKISRKKLMIGAGILMVTTWGGLLLAMKFAAPNEDYIKWQRAHEKWKNKEVVGEIYDRPTRDLIDPVAPSDL